jgi:hypothetical protein
MFKEYSLIMLKCIIIYWDESPCHVHDKFKKKDATVIDSRSFEFHLVLGSNL